MSTVLIKNGYVVDPDTKFEGKADILVKDGLIERVAPSLDEEAALFNILGRCCPRREPLLLLASRPELCEPQLRICCLLGGQKKQHLRQHGPDELRIAPG